MKIKINTSDIKKDSLFDIRIKDNFLNENDFNKVKSYIKTIQWTPTKIVYDNKNPKHVWFTEAAPDEIKNIMLNEVSNFFNLKILQSDVCHYTFVLKSQKIEVHNDKAENTNFQTIFYIEGDENVHAGTGFYIKKDTDTYELNTHVGFKPNRIVSWDSNVYHAPLSFTEQFKPRISLITQYKVEKKC